MPATRSSNRGGNFSRCRVEANLRSKSVELTILGASTLLTESSAVLLCRKVAFPAKLSPCSFLSCLHAVTVPIKCNPPKTLTMPV